MRTREPGRAHFCLLAVATVLAACGGGGGGSGTVAPAPAPEPANRAPSAVAGPDLAVTGGELVTLDGSASSDPDGTISRWSWTVSEGPELELSGADSPHASFTAPASFNSYDVVLALTVTDDDGASASDSVTISVTPAEEAPRVSLGGRVVPSVNQVLDSDTNDPANLYRANDSRADAQPVGNPVTIGGYVNLAGTGAEGRSRVGGDPEDFFAVELLEGQSITLLVADYRGADADLYLYDDSGEIVDFSIEVGELERVSVPADGRYAVNVSAFDGATNYTLAIGGAASVAAVPRPTLVPGEVIVRYRGDDRRAEAEARREAARAAEDLAINLGLDPVAGAGGRERLLSLQPVSTGSPRARARQGRAAAKADAIADPARRRDWDTLLAVKTLRRNPAVASAAPNYRRKPAALPNDEFLDLQWHFTQLRLPTAWNSTTGDPGIVIAVVDTGILAGHPDLAGQLVDGYDFIRDPEVAADGDGIDPDPEEAANPTEPEPVAFHGTHVAGTIAARGNNTIGVAGVAYRSRLMPLRALGATSGTSYDVAQAVRYAAGLPNDSGQLPARPADIINLSLGGEGFSQVAQDLYREVREAGILLVASAGNESSDTPSYPAAYDGVIAVAAVDAQREAAGYSNFGPHIDIAAPGGDTSADLTGDGFPDGILSTGRSSEDFAYTFLQGTSMAAPHVSGILALMKSINPALSPAAVDRLLQDGELTTELGAGGRDDRFGYGLANAARAVNAALRSTGAAVEEPREVTASARTLNFGSILDNLQLDIAGSGGAVVTEIGSNAPWLRASAEATDGDGLGRYRVTVDRGGLDAGVYAAQLRVESNANPLLIDVIASVAGATRADLGTVYILLYEPAIDTVVAQTTTRLEDGDYDFSLPGVAAGVYQLFAGTDFDNDLLICDPGEACGAYLTVDQPVSIEADGDRGDLVFPIEYQVTIPSVDATAARPGDSGLSREQR
ncbi:MAG: S8 family peptidase [Pseudohaliea sp.]